VYLCVANIVVFWILLCKQAENCKIYNNDKSSEYYQTAEKFEVYILNLFGRDEAKGKTSEAR
jgi:hypothetical protein